MYRSLEKRLLRTVPTYSVWADPMPDYFGPRASGPKGPTPDGFTEWKGYRLSGPRASYRWRDLQSIAVANGWELSHELLKKWRLWRFLPAPRSGGPTGRGAGKGEQWSVAAARKVAWLSRWLSDTLTYDVLRLGMWPWTPELERDRSADLIHSVNRFVAQDEDYHDRVVAQDPTNADPVLSAYKEVILGEEPSHGDRARLLHGLDMDDAAEDKRAMERLRLTNFFEMREVLQALTPEDIQRFIPVFRASYGSNAGDLAQILWDNPIDVARSVVGALHVYVLERGGRIRLEGEASPE